MKKTILTIGILLILAACQTKTTPQETTTDTLVVPVDTVVVGGAGQSPVGEVPKDFKK